VWLGSYNLLTKTQQNLRVARNYLHLPSTVHGRASSSQSFQPVVKLLGACVPLPHPLNPPKVVQVGFPQVLQQSPLACRHNSCQSVSCPSMHGPFTFSPCVAITAVCTGVLTCSHHGVTMESTYAGKAIIDWQSTRCVVQEKLSISVPAPPTPPPTMLPLEGPATVLPSSRSPPCQNDNC